MTTINPNNTPSRNIRKSWLIDVLVVAATVVETLIATHRTFASLWAAIVKVTVLLFGVALHSSLLGLHPASKDFLSQSIVTPSILL
jgi:hypothetical protein